MKTGTLVIQFDYDDEEVSLSQIEKAASRIMDRYWSEVEEITHLEAAPGSMSEAFGIEEV